jgi:hypothetical protein
VQTLPRRPKAAAKEENETLRLHLNMCKEARQIGGVLAGAQMWKKLGLPMVPALDDPIDLFDWAARRKAA